MAHSKEFYLKDVEIFEEYFYADNLYDVRSDNELSEITLI